MNVLEMEDDLEFDLDVTSARVLNPFLIETFMLLVTKQCLGMRQCVGGCIQFDFSGDVQGTCHFHMRHGHVRSVKGAAHIPNLIVSGPYSLWRDIISGKADCTRMLIAGRIQAHGNLSLLKVFMNP